MTFFNLNIGINARQFYHDIYLAHIIVWHLSKSSLNSIDIECAFVRTKNHIVLALVSCLTQQINKFNK
jgi:hypothetical protein